jgi:ADP-heptose:LPS heptosyltransferase
MSGHIQAPPLTSVESIAVLRANAIGDYLAGEPALTALRTAAPQAHITLLATPWHSAALTGRPGPVDEVVVVEPPGGNGTDRTGFYREMRARRFDIALQMHGGGRNSNPIVSALGAAFTAGLRAADAPPLDADLAYQYWQPEIFKCLDVVSMVGAAPVRARPEFPVVPADRAAGATALSAAGIDGRDEYVVVHPGATDPRRRWPALRFARVADALASRGAQVAVIGTEDDAVEEVLRRCPHATAVPTPQFPALVGVLAGASVLVGNDSGPRHLAEAVGTATVSVYWCGNVINAGPLSRDRHRVHISWTTACPRCGRNCVGEPFPPRCYDEISFVRDVPTQSVTRSAEELLGQERERGGRRDEGGRRHEHRGGEARHR